MGSDDPSPSVPRKRKQQDNSNEDLAERVRQLEALVLRQAGANGINQPLYSPPTQQPTASPGLGTGPNNFENKPKTASIAGEEAAVAALSTLAKAIPKEGGSEARIYSGPGTIAALLEASGFTASSLSAPSTDGRARASDYQLYSGARGIAGMVHAHPRLAKLADALEEQKAKLPPPVMAHYLFNFYHSSSLFFKDKLMTYPRGAYQGAYDALFSLEDQDNSAEASAARALQFPQLSSQHSLSFISHIFAIFALCEQTSDGAGCSRLMPPNSTGSLAGSE